MITIKNTTNKHQKMETIIMESMVIKSIFDEPITKDLIINNEETFKDLIEKSEIFELIINNKTTTLPNKKLVDAIQILHKYNVKKYYDICLEEYISRILKLKFDPKNNRLNEDIICDIKNFNCDMTKILEYLYCENYKSEIKNLSINDFIFSKPLMEYGLDIHCGDIDEILIPRLIKYVDLETFILLNDPTKIICALFDDEDTFFLRHHANLCDIFYFIGKHNRFDLFEWLHKNGKIYDIPGIDLSDIYNGAAKYGNFDLLKFAVQYDHNVIHSSVCNYAAYNGHIKILQWAIENGCSLDTHLNGTIARNGQFEVLEYLSKTDNLFGPDICAGAAYGNHFEILKWAYKNGCPMDVNVCAYAAKNGNFEMLKWARENDCKWDVDTCIYAAKNGNFDILKWSINDGYKHDIMICKLAVSSGNLEIVKWLIDNGFKYDDAVFLTSIKYEHIEIINFLYTLYFRHSSLDPILFLRYAIEHGKLESLKFLCKHIPSNLYELCRYAAAAGQIKVLKWLYTQKETGKCDINHNIIFGDICQSVLYNLCFSENKMYDIKFVLENIANNHIDKIIYGDICQSVLYNLCFSENKMYDIKFVLENIDNNHIDKIIYDSIFSVDVEYLVGMSNSVPHSHGWDTDMEKENYDEEKYEENNNEKYRYDNTILCTLEKSILERIKFLHFNGCKIYKYMFDYAIIHGLTSVLVWGYYNGFNNLIDHNICQIITHEKYFHYKIFRWAYCKGYHMNEQSWKIIIHKLKISQIEPSTSLVAFVLKNYNNIDQRIYKILYQYLDKKDNWPTIETQLRYVYI